MNAVKALERGRARAETLMLDTCIIGRQAGLYTDRATGQVTPTYTTVYEGKCKVQSKNASTAKPDAGEHSYTVVSRQVHIPANAADIRDGDVITITASTLNPFAVGNEYVVDGFTTDTFDTAARIPVKEITS